MSVWNCESNQMAFSSADNSGSCISAFQSTVKCFKWLVVTGSQIQLLVRLLIFATTATKIFRYSLLKHRSAAVIHQLPIIYLRITTAVADQPPFPRPVHFDSQTKKTSLTSFVFRVASATLVFDQTRVRNMKRTNFSISLFFTTDDKTTLRNW